MAKRTPFDWMTASQKSIGLVFMQNQVLSIFCYPIFYSFAFRSLWTVVHGDTWSAPNDISHSVQAWASNIQHTYESYNLFYVFVLCCSTRSVKYYNVNLYEFGAAFLWVHHESLLWIHWTFFSDNVRNK